MDPGKDRPLDLPLNALGTMSQLYQVSLTLLEDAAEYLGSLCGSFPNGGRLPSYDGICGGAVFHVNEPMGKRRLAGPRVVCSADTNV